MFVEISQNSQEKTPVLESFFFIKKETLTQVFPVNFAKFLRTPFLTENLRVAASGITAYCIICGQWIHQKSFLN